MHLILSERRGNVNFLIIVVVDKKKILIKGYTKQQETIHYLYEKKQKQLLEKLPFENCFQNIFKDQTRSHVLYNTPQYVGLNRRAARSQNRIEVPLAAYQHFNNLLCHHKKQLEAGRHFPLTFDYFYVRKSDLGAFKNSIAVGVKEGIFFK